MIKVLSNNTGASFLEALFWIVLVVLVIAVPIMGLSVSISDVFVSMISRVNQIGTP